MNFLILTFSFLALCCALFVISSTNPIHSVFALIGLFINSSALLFTLQSDFLAIILLVVYVGAIAILFLFVIMMLHLNLALLHENLLRYLPIGCILGFLFLINSFYIGDIFIDNQFNPFSDFLINNNQINSIHIFSNNLYSTYSVYFLISSLILFVAMVGAIVITL